MALVEWIESVPVWLWISLAAVLIAFDAVVTSSVYLGCLGIALFITGLFDSLGLSGNLQILAMVLVFPLSLWQAPRVLSRFASVHSLAPDLESMDGNVGRVLDGTDSGGTMRAHFADQGDWQIRCAEKADLRPGDPVRVVGREGLALIVERAGDAAH